jgi:hypothetical protein
MIIFNKYKGFKYAKNDGIKPLAGEEKLRMMEAFQEAVQTIIKNRVTPC